MKSYRTIAAFLAALVLACGVVAWEWYEHVGRSGVSAPPPTQAVTQAPSAAPPVVYVPVTAAPASATPSLAPATPQPSATSVTPVSALPAAATPAPKPTATPEPAPLSAGTTPRPRSYPVTVATLAPTSIMPPVVREAPDAPPRILAMSLSSPVAHSGDVVSGTVETTSNVSSVVAQIAGIAQPMEKVGVGKFTLTYRVPRLPFFLHRTWTIVVTARNDRGDSATSSIPITIR